MTAYHASAYDAKPEIDRGYNAVIFGTYRVGNGTVSIRDYDDSPLREASPFEASGIIQALDDIAAGKLTQYSSETARMLDLAARAAESGLTDHELAVLAADWRMENAATSDRDLAMLADDAFDWVDAKADEWEYRQAAYHGIQLY